MLRPYPKSVTVARLVKRLVSVRVVFIEQGFPIKMSIFNQRSVVRSPHSSIFSLIHLQIVFKLLGQFYFVMFNYLLSEIKQCILKAPTPLVILYKTVLSLGVSQHMCV